MDSRDMSTKCDVLRDFGLHLRALGDMALLVGDELANSGGEQSISASLQEIFKQMNKQLSTWELVGSEAPASPQSGRRTAPLIHQSTVGKNECGGNSEKPAEGGGSQIFKLMQRSETDHGDEMYRRPCPSEVRATYDTMAAAAQIWELDIPTKVLDALFGSHNFWACVNKRRLPFSWLEHITSSNRFGCLISACIILNVVLVIMHSDYSVKAAFRTYDKRQAFGDAMMEEPPGWYVVVDMIFMVIFTSELILRLLAEELRFFVGPNYKWNGFDSLLVAMALVEPFLKQLEFDPMLARVFRLIRSARALKIIRVFKSFRELRVLVGSICHILLPLTWSAMTMFVVIMMFSVLFLHAVSSYSLGKSPETEHVETMRRYFHSIPMCILTLFMALTGGESWWFIVEPLLDISFAYGLIFVMFIVFMQLGVLNIVTSIFVENASSFTQQDSDMIELAAAEEHMYKMKTLTEIFDTLDADKSNAITMDEFQRWTDLPKTKAFFERVLHVQAWKVRSFFMLLDMDRNGTISREEFTVGCMSLTGQAQNVQQEMMVHMSKLVKRDLKKIQHDIADIRSSLQFGSKTLGFNTLGCSVKEL